MTTKEELIAQLRDEHGIDIEDMETKLSTLTEQVEELSQRPDADAFGKQVLEVIKASGAPVPTPEGEEEEVGVRDVAEAVIELSNELRDAKTELASVAQEREAARLAAAESEVSALIKEGRILPAQREGMVKLAQEDRETFEKVVPSAPIVDLTERGVTDPEVPDIDEYNAEVARLTNIVGEDLQVPTKK